VAAAFEFGLYSFGELTPDPQSGKAISAQQRLADILAAAKLADEAGFDVFAIGEHHRLDMAIAATPVVLAAIAASTKTIRLASAVTILSTADPVRVFEDFATVDLISGGRAEVIAGRGVFTESFPLFGFDLADYDALFAEKLELLMKLNAADHVTWQGRFRPPLNDAPIPPRPAQSGLPIWVGTGGTKSSVERAAALGLPLALANISIPPAQLAPLAGLYRRTGAAAGTTPPRSSSASRATFTSPKIRKPHATNSIHIIPAIFAIIRRRNIAPATSHAPTTTRWPRLRARCSSAARNRSSTKSCTNASYSATSASSPRSTSAACRLRKWQR